MRTGRVILLLAIGAAIVAGGAYYWGLFGAPESAVAPPANVAGAPPKGEPATSPAGKPAPGPGEEKAARPKVSAPAFDVVRVEPSGDMVIAGTAEPNSDVEIVTGSSVIATARADPGGNFAAVLDKPLKPGDYQIVLRATSPDGDVATSTQTAVVSVPQDKTGEVLALVEQPGEPSRLITKPGARQDEAAGGQAPAGAAGERTESGAAEQQGAAGRETASIEEPADAAKPAEGAAKPAAEPQPGAELAEKEPPASSGQAAPKSEYSVAVEAVEIDGKKIFIAGSGKPGLPVMIYANDILLGQVKVSPVGRFLLETERDLPVGDYIIRADMLDETGAKVLARAAVPFQREAGESVAAVAPSLEGGNDRNGATAGQPEGAMELPKMNSEIANTPPTVLGEKLSNVRSSVIIRRGDNLWRISRRVYGRGIRYTTIYLANKDQIRNPDLIWPGQVFAVPRQTPEGEKADTTVLEKRWAEEKDKSAGNQ